MSLLNKKADIGIIGALKEEVERLIDALEEREILTLGGVEFNYGKIEDKRVVVALCGVGKVFAALCAESMIVGFAPSLIVNTGVGGALASGLKTGDIVIADKLCQHDMDTSAIGDPVGLVSGINKLRPLRSLPLSLVLPLQSVLSPRAISLSRRLRIKKE